MNNDLVFLVVAKRYICPDPWMIHIGIFCSSLLHQKIHFKTMPNINIDPKHGDRIN
jgi:hypothetical protein